MIIVIRNEVLGDLLDGILKYERKVSLEKCQAFLRLMSSNQLCMELFGLPSYNELGTPGLGSQNVLTIAKINT